MQKVDDFLIGHFPHMILSFSAFWFGLIAYGLLNQ